MIPRLAQRVARCLPAAAAVIAVAAGALAAAPVALAAPTPPDWQLESRPAPTRLPPEGEGQMIVTASNLVGAVPAEVSEVVLTDVLPAGVKATGIRAHSDSTPRANGHNLKYNSVTGELENPHGWACPKEPELVEGRDKITCTYQQLLPSGERLEVWINVKTELASYAGCTESSVPACPESELALTRRSAPGEPETREAFLARPLKVSAGEDKAGAEQFGVEQYALSAEHEDGSTDTEAGSHPYQLTSTFNLNEGFEELNIGEPRMPSAPALQRNLSFSLPPGLIGDPRSVAQCTGVAFGILLENGVDGCPEDSAIGIAQLTYEDPVLVHYHTGIVPVFNLVPEKGEPARFGFMAVHVPVVLDTSLRSGGDYGVNVDVHNASEAIDVLGAKVTIWGTPYESSHDDARGWACIGYATGASCGAEKIPSEPQAFLTLPTACSEHPISTVMGESWPYEEDGKTKISYIGQGEGENPENSEYRLAPFSGCGALEFTPTISVEAEQHEADTPTGMTVRVHVPQESALSPSGRAQSALRDTTVTLPEGVLLNPSAANGLLACAEGEREGSGGVGFLGVGELDEEASYRADEFSAALPEHLEPGVNFCPEAAKVGEVHVKTPDLPKELEGSVYLAAQTANPFGSLFAIYIVAEEPESKVLVKLAGEVTLNAETGRITTVFSNTPDVSFEELTLKLYGGEAKEGGQRAQLTTPVGCGRPSTGTEASFTPWAEEGGKPGVQAPTVDESKGFDNTSGAEGTTCTEPQRFSPSFQAGSSNTQAAAYTPFEVTIGRAGADQTLTGVSVTTPPGLAAMISSVNLCQEPQASEGTCGAESKIGEATASVGLGGEPYTVKGGEVFLTGPYDGAPFGLSIKVPAEAGPFHFGYVVTRSTITVNPNTAAVTINSPLPTMLTPPTLHLEPQLRAKYSAGIGVPVQLKQIHVTVNRPGFEFNPTNCSRMQITGTLSGAQGGKSAVSSPFQATNCTSLPFHPTLSAAVGGHASKAGGASLNVKVTSAGLGQANIEKVFLTIPKILPSRLQPTLQHACLAKVFEANPAGCDEDSVIGTGTIHTPVFKNPLSGPAYVVSHGGAAFPDVEFVLQGEGITIVLDGKTKIKNGVTYSRFESSPDAPFTTFETSLPTGPHSILAINTEEAPNYDLCGKDITIPTEIYAQNGDLIKKTTQVEITGCGGALGTKTTKPSRAQELQKALAACKKKDAGKHKKAKRASCEKAAHKKYGAKASAKKSSRKSAPGRAKK
jgi:hypothetical protein